MRRPVLWLCFPLLLLPAGTSAQHSLVLSGGGARGLAHAGVLLGIERLGYAPIAVAGTSMGSIVGAMYASGMTPRQIWETVAAQDWDELFAPDAFPVGPAREPRRPLITVAFAQDAEPVLGGFVPEAGINRQLTHLFFDAGVRAGNDFDSLPRPYRAMAADLRTGEPVVLARGDLARATRASMAVPGAFAPVRWGDLVLVDGGIADNLPIGAARALANAPVIAVDVVRPTGELQEVSALDIGVRALRLLMQNARASYALRDTADLFIVAELPHDVSEAAFPADAGRLLAIGYESALAQLAPAPRSLVPRTRRRPAPLTLDSLVVEGDDVSTRALVRRTFASALGPYRPAHVLARMDALYESGMFHGVWPRVERDTVTGASLLVVRAEPTPRAVASGAVGWDNDVGARAWIALRSRARLFLPFEVRGAASLERYSRWVTGSANFYATLLPPWSLSAGMGLREDRIREFVGEDVGATARVRRTGGWVGIERRRLDPEHTLAVLLRAEEIDAHTGAAGLSFGPLLRVAALPAADAVVGAPSVLELELRGGDVAYARMHAAGTALFHPGPVRLALVADGAYVHGDDAPADVIPFVGGRQGAPWLRWGELRGAARVLGGIDVAVPFVLAGHARLRLRTGAAGADWTDLGAAAWTWGGELGAVWTTALGPVSTGIAVGREGRWRAQLGVGAEW